MLTEYGYDADYIEDVTSIERVKAITGTSAPDDRIESGIMAAQAAVRSYCGWHVAPSAQCAFNAECQGFPEIQLPATVVSSVESVKVDGTAVDFEWKRNGRIRRKDGKPWPSAWGSVEIEYSAGINESSIEQIVAKMAASSIASPAGVRSESVGSMSVTYSDTELTLSSNMMAVLDRYRLKARP